MTEKLLSDEILFAKGNDTVIIPTKREEDGAFDIYANFSEDYMIIQPHETKMIPTGLHSAFSSDYVAILKERGSNGSKGIGQRAGVVDSGYRGEWFVPLTNHNKIPVIIAKEESVRLGNPKKPTGEFVKKEGGRLTKIGDEVFNTSNIIIYPYEKAIAQCIMVEVPKLKTKEVSMEEIMSYKSERGTGALGSSQK